MTGGTPTRPGECPGGCGMPTEECICAPGRWAPQPHTSLTQLVRGAEAAVWADPEGHGTTREQWAKSAQWPEPEKTTRHRGIAVGDVVEILAGEEAGSWGVVRLIEAEEFHVGLAGGSGELVFDREELRRPRNQEEFKRLHRLPS